MWSLLCPIFLLLAAPTIFADVICSQAVWGNPAQEDCLRALAAAMPYPDQYPRYFIEDPILTTRPQANWPAFIDPRPRRAQTLSVQLPKFWGYGSCNIALTTYFHHSTIPLTSWSTIYFTGRQLLNICSATYQGGATTVNGIDGRPTLSLFLWMNGAAFQDVLNGYMSMRFPSGIDPRHPFGLFNGSAGLGNSSSNVSYSAFPQNLDGSNSNRTRLAGVTAPVDSS